MEYNAKDRSVTFSNREWSELKHNYHMVKENEEIMMHFVFILPCDVIAYGTDLFFNFLSNDIRVINEIKEAGFDRTINYGKSISIAGGKVSYGMVSHRYATWLMMLLGMRW